MPSIFINAAPGKNATPHREYSRIIYMSEKWQVVLELWRAVCYDKGKSERGMQMNSQQRRQQLLVLLRQNSGPVSATAIAKEFGVSRQIIVGDVALLRAAGEQISATRTCRPGPLPAATTTSTCCRSCTSRWITAARCWM